MTTTPDDTSDRPSAGGTAVTLYGMKNSHPVLAARLMLASKGVTYNAREILPGLHPMVVRAAGFAGQTVPAIQLGRDRRVQGTLAISRALDEAVPDRPLFPRDPRQREAVQRAERWAHDELQPVATRVFRWAGATNNAVRAWMVREVLGWPAPTIFGRAFKPVMGHYARAAGASPERVRQDLADLPAKLDEADDLLASGVTGGPTLNAADCQIISSLRLLLAHEDLRPALLTWRCGRAALERLPDFPGQPVGAFRPVPAALPPGWLTALDDHRSSWS